jgi:hypothetical protein
MCNKEQGYYQTQAPTPDPEFDLMMLTKIAHALVMYEGAKEVEPVYVGDDAYANPSSWVGEWQGVRFQIFISNVNKV